MNKLHKKEIDCLINCLKINNFKTKNYDIKTNQKINVIFNLLDKIKSMGDNDLKILYFPVKKEERNLKICWYRLETTKYKGFRIITLNHKTIINADITENNKDILTDKYLLILDFLIKKIKWCLKLLREEKYNDHIENNLPLENRFGVIKRKDYWQVYPNLKRQLLNQISPVQIRAFINSNLNKPTSRIIKMTSGKYFKYVKKAYKALNYEVSIDDKKTYFKYSSGKDDNLSKINPKSSKEFDNWYNDENRFGGHPFEIIKESSSLKINLYIEYDNGYYLALNGRNILKNSEIVKIYLSLKNEVPIYLYNHKAIKKSLCGDDYLGVVPTNLYLVNCNKHFKNYEPLEFIYYNSKFLKYIKWQEIEKAYLK